MSAEPLEIILQDIERALNHRLWYVALIVTLSVPDICSLLEDEEDGWSKREKYARWFDQNVKDSVFEFTGDDCYSLRGGVLHKGKMGHAKWRYERIIFTMPDMAGGKWHGNKFGNTALQLNVMTFCQTIITAARKWYAANYENQNVVANSVRLLRTRDDGFPPFIVGNVPVIT